MISFMVLTPLVYLVATKIKYWVLDNIDDICNKIRPHKLTHDSCIKKQDKVVVTIDSNIKYFIESI